MKILFEAVFLCLLLAGSLYAQDSETSEPNVEELYLEESLAVQIIYQGAQSPERDTKLAALNDIQYLLQSEGTDGTEQIIDILSDLSSEGTQRVVREEGYIKNDFPDVRREAVRLLGVIGNDKAVKLLNSVLYSDDEAIVIGEAFYSLSRTETNLKKNRNRAMADVMRRQTALKKDNSLAFAFLESIETIVKREGSVADPTVFEEIIKITDARNGYKRAVRIKARDVLRNLKGI